MRLKLIVAGLVGAALTAGLVCPAGAGWTAQAADGRADAEGGCRSSWRPHSSPASYDAMTADQQAFVKSVLSGPRPTSADRSAS